MGKLVWWSLRVEPQPTIIEPPFKSAWDYVPLPTLSLFPQYETKESPQGPNEFFVCQIDTADGGNLGWFHLFSLVSVAQQYHRRLGCHTLQLGYYVAAVLKVVLMDDDGVNRPTRKKQFRSFAIAPHQQAIAGTRCWCQGVRRVFGIRPHEQ
jgi:hypothetical protein